MKKTLILVLALLSLNVVFSQNTFTIGNLTYQEISKENQGLIVISGSVSGDTLIIPSNLTHDGRDYTVTTIGVSAFSYLNAIKVVVLPPTITTIEGWAFAQCENLESINFPDSLAYIGNSAFECCHSLPFISIPYRVTYIGDAAFKHCESLTQVFYNAKNCDDFVGFTTLPFAHCPIERIGIGDSVQKIPKNFAPNLPNLIEVTIFEGLTHIGDGAFAQNDSLSIINLPTTLVSLGNTVFKDCKSLTKIVIPNSVDSLGKYPFPFESGVFSGCTALTDLTLGENLQFIAEYTFLGCNALQTVTTLAQIPPQLQWEDNCFPKPNHADLIVACGSLTEYVTSQDWTGYFTNSISEIVYNVDISSNDENKGIVTMQRDCSTATLTAIANTCFRFHTWSDGNTENPRVVSLDSDTNLIAIFGEILTIIDTTINQGEVYTDNGFNESEEGTYYQYFTTDEGCDSTVVLNLSIQVGLKDVEETTLSFYPNPTSGEINFTDKVEKIEVMDLSGKTMRTFTHSQTINIDFLPSGFYYLRLLYQDKVLIRKLIKQ